MWWYFCQQNTLEKCSICSKPITDRVSRLSLTGICEHPCELREKKCTHRINVLETWALTKRRVAMLTSVGDLPALYLGLPPTARSGSTGLCIGLGEGGGVGAGWAVLRDVGCVQGGGWGQSCSMWPVCPGQSCRLWAAYRGSPAGHWLEFTLFVYKYTFLNPIHTK